MINDEQYNISKFILTLINAVILLVYDSYVNKFSLIKIRNKLHCHDDNNELIYLLVIFVYKTN